MLSVVTLGQQQELNSYSLSVPLSSQWNIVLGELNTQALALSLISHILHVHCQIPQANSCVNIKKESMSSVFRYRRKLLLMYRIHASHDFKV